MAHASSREESIRKILATRDRRIALTGNSLIMKRGSTMATFEPKITRIESPTSVQSKIKSGRELVKQGRAEQALAEFEAALKLDPNSKSARLGSGALKARL